MARASPWHLLLFLFFFYVVYLANPATAVDPADGPIDGVCSTSPIAHPFANCAWPPQSPTNGWIKVALRPGAPMFTPPFVPGPLHIAFAHGSLGDYFDLVFPPDLVETICRVSLLKIHLSFSVHSTLSLSSFTAGDKLLCCWYLLGPPPQSCCTCKVSCSLEGVHLCRILSVHCPASARRSRSYKELAQSLVWLGGKPVLHGDYVLLSLRQCASLSAFLVRFYLCYESCCSVALGPSAGLASPLVSDGASVHR